jgi:hypothetical protein
MNFAAVLAQLSDLPATFMPSGNPYGQFVNALAAAETLYTAGADATVQQVIAFQNAIDGWIDLWGLMFEVPRNQSEGNIPYSLRIAETVLAWVGTLPAIQIWLNLFAPGGSVTENASGSGYVITLPSFLTQAQITAFVASLGRIRPVGVPFTVLSSRSGVYLGSEAFLGDGVDYGSYLTGGISPLSLGLGATTCSAQPLVPDLYLVDPNLAQPGLLSRGLQGIWPPLNQPVQLRNNQSVPVQITGLANNGGVLQVLNLTGWLPSGTGLPAGGLWSPDLGGLAYVVPGATPNPSAPPVIFGLITAAALLALGGANLPTTDPGNALQIWNNEGFLCVSLG